MSLRHYDEENEFDDLINDAIDEALGNKKPPAEGAVVRRCRLMTSG